MYLRLRRSDGEVVYVHATGVPRRLGDKVIGSISIITDLTEQKKIETALKAERDKAEKYLNIAEVILVALDTNARITLLNRKGYQILGYEDGGLIGKNWIKTCLRPEDHEPVLTTNDKIASGEIEPFEYYENYVLTKRGEERYIAWHTTVLKDDKGRIIGTLSSGEDITERKNVEEALKNSEQEKAAILGGLKNGAVEYLDPQMRIIWVNEAVQKSLGLSVKEMQGKYCYELIEGIKAPCPGCTAVIACKTGKPQEGELVTPDGKTWISRSNPVIDADGQVSGVVHVAINITKRRQMEEALREARDYLDKIINSIGDPMFVKDRQHRFILVNDAFCAVTDHTREEFIGKTDYDFFLREQVNVFWEKEELVFQTGKENVNEELITDPQGGTHTIVTKKTLYTDASENKSIVGIIRDITDRKKAEEALSESEEKYRLLINTANESVVVAQDGLFKFVNPMTLDLLGADSEQELIDRPFPEFIHPDDRSMVVENYRRRIANEAASPRYSFRMVARDGIVKWVEINAALIEWQGKPATLNFLTDITERKRAEEALQESEERFKAQYQGSPAPTFTWQKHGADFVLVDFNEAAKAITDGKVSEFVGRMASDLYADRQEILRDLLRCHDERKVIRREIRSQNFVPGALLVATFAYVPPDLVLVHLEDITERKRIEKELRQSRNELEQRVKERTEELARKNTEMEQFIYTVSHDLRSPLITLSGFLGFLKQDAERGDLDRMQADFRITNEAVTKMDRLLLETLELSRIGRVVNPPEDAPFGEIVEDALGQTSEKIRSKGFKVSVAKNLPVVHVDRLRITGVLVNLIENSIKYMELQANPEIEIGQRIDGNDRIFFVWDNGIGLDPSQHDKVFELFYKVDKKSEGSGAGLAIAKRIIEVHGGRIWIESEIGKGCTVCFTLPQA